MEWLSTPSAQSLFAKLNLEYPVNPSVEASSLIKDWGSFKQNTMNLNLAGKLQSKAIQLMDEVGYY